MRNLAIGLAVVSLLAAGTMAFAHGTGSWDGGHMTGYGYDRKFLDETTELRKELHEKKFDYFEAVRNPDTTPETITKLEKKIRELQDKVYEKTPRSTFGGFGTYGHCR